IGVQIPSQPSSRFGHSGSCLRDLLLGPWARVVVRKLRFRCGFTAADRSRERFLPDLGKNPPGRSTPMFRARQALEGSSIRPYTGSMHVHVHGAGGPTRVLKISLAVTLAYIGLLVVAGIRAHSLALLSEAGHNLSDFLALLPSLVAVYFQARPASSTKTYGYHRAGVLAALVSASSLVAVSFFIFYEAFRRLQHPQHVQAGLMMWVAAAGG